MEEYNWWLAPPKKKSHIKFLQNKLQSKEAGFTLIKLKGKLRAVILKRKSLQTKGKFKKICIGFKPLISENWYSPD